MSVKDLILILQGFDPESPVLVESVVDGFIEYLPIDLTVMTESTPDGKMKIVILPKE